MGFYIYCTQCGQKLEAEEEHVGNDFPCPICKKTLRIEEKNSTPHFKVKRTFKGDYLSRINRGFKEAIRRINDSIKLYPIVGIFLGFVIGVSVNGIGSFAKDYLLSEEPVFRVFQKADSPRYGWYGSLITKNKTTRAIVDFGESVSISSEDRIKARFKQTSNVGEWARSPYRVYKVLGEYKVLDPLNE